MQLCDGACDGAIDGACDGGTDGGCVGAIDGLTDGTAQSYCNVPNCTTGHTGCSRDRECSVVQHEVVISDTICSPSVGT